MQSWIYSMLKFLKDHLFLFFASFFILLSLGTMIFNLFFTVKQQTVVILERFGRFLRFCKPGLHMRMPFMDKIRGTLDLRIQQLDVKVETKTEDNVFVSVLVALQFRAISSKIYEAFYQLENPEEQITSYIFDVVRAKVPSLCLDDVFSKKDDIAISVSDELSSIMAEFGYEIVKALITDIQPDEHVKQAMNEINTSQRLRMAAQERGEAEKIMRIKQAEAESEANILHGQGIAGQRRAIMEGLSASLEEVHKNSPQFSQKNVMEMVLLIQYFDMLREIGGSSRSNTVFVEHSPQNIANISEQLRHLVFAPKPDLLEKALDTASLPESP